MCHAVKTMVMMVSLKLFRPELDAFRPCCPMLCPVPPVPCTADFKIDRSSHINKDVPLARSCAEDAAKLCKEANDAVRPASVLACLR
eukprot:1146939-Pelagomonas_calceolata.AAC.11